MGINRRNFLARASAGLVGGLVLSSFTDDIAKTDLPDPSLLISNEDKYWKKIRQQFSIFKGLTYLNNGTMGPSPKPVVDAVHQYMKEMDDFGSYGGWEKAAEKLAKFVKVTADEIALTHNVTEGINIVCWGLPLKKGDEVIMTTHEHVGNAAPWLNRAKLDGIVIKTFTPASTAAETLQRINDLITSNTKVFAIPHIPCTQGQILPAKEICSLAKSKGIYAFIDGAHGPGMLQLDLKDMGCDFYATCSHKWMLGPKGTGFLYVKKEMQETLQALMIGGGGSGDWNMTVAPPTFGGYQPNAKRYYYGTQNRALYGGVEASIDFINSIGMANIEKRIRSLAAYTQQQILNIGDRIEMLTPTEEISRGAVIGFKVKNKDFNEINAHISKQSIRIRAVPENGLNSLRVSTHIYNSKEEIDRFIIALKEGIGTK